MDMPGVFQKYRREINEELHRSLDGFQSPLYDMLRYQLGWMDKDGKPSESGSGKALRPTLCLLTCEALTGSFQKALPAAAALELVHNFSLIHDDIQDNDRERRHRPTVWAVWGKPQAINAGNAMRIVANLSLLRLMEHGVSLEKLVRSQRRMEETCLELIEGQYLDISFETRPEVRLDEYLEMIAGKTAALIACAFELGALLSDQEEEIIAAFSNCGKNLGMAFQLKDDILGVWGDQQRTGKPTGSDILRKKKSFPIVFALDRANQAQKTELLRIYSQRVVGEAERQIVMQILAETDAKTYAQKMVLQYSNQALAALERGRLSAWGYQSFQDLIHFLIEREA